MFTSLVIKADATPYDVQYMDYFQKREQRREIISRIERRWLAYFPDMVFEERLSYKDKISCLTILKFLSVLQIGRSTVYKIKLDITT